MGLGESPDVAKSLSKVRGSKPLGSHRSLNTVPPWSDDTEINLSGDAQE